MSLLKMHLMMVWGVEDYSQQDNLLQVELLLQKVEEFIKSHPVKLMSKVMKLKRSDQHLLTLIRQDLLEQ